MGNYASVDCFLFTAFGNVHEHLHAKDHFLMNLLAGMIQKFYEYRNYACIFHIFHKLWQLHAANPVKGFHEAEQIFKLQTEEDWNYVFQYSHFGYFLSNKFVSSGEQGEYLDYPIYVVLNIMFFVLLQSIEYLSQPREQPKFTEQATKVIFWVALDLKNIPDAIYRGENQLTRALPTVVLVQETDQDGKPSTGNEHLSGVVIGVTKVSDKVGSVLTNSYWISWTTELHN